MNPSFCEPNCPKLINCGLMTKDDQIKEMVNRLLNDVQKCPCSECIVIMKCGTQTGREHVCEDRIKIFEKVEYEICVVARKLIKKEKERRKNDILYKRSSSLE